MLTPADRALVEIGMQLRELGYSFTTVTPETHRRNNARGARAKTLRDVFGWSRPFGADILPPGMLERMRTAGVIGEDHVSKVRFSTLGGGLYVHSAYPTLDEDSVFFGPDTYRFCAQLEGRTARRVVDVCCGSGVGGLSVRADSIVLADINDKALRFARVNAELAGLSDRVEIHQGDLFAGIEGDVDLIIANPPYLLDPRHRTYRDGGGSVGEGLAVRIVREGLARLAPGGELVLYTGAPIIDGRDPVRDAIAPHLGGTRWAYREIDPDVFGEEIELPHYASVERIAAVVLTATVG